VFCELGEIVPVNKFILGNIRIVAVAFL